MGTTPDFTPPPAPQPLPPVEVDLEPSWKAALAEEFRKPYFHNLVKFLKQEKQQGQQIFPPGKQIFNAFAHTPFDQVRVVILGQDPYHDVGQAHGLCFSVTRGTPIPPSLRNMFQEIEQDVGAKPAAHGDLTSWADQGVLLLNATLTVRAHQAGSHQGQGWEVFTDEVIRQLNARRQGLVFLLWGRYARNKATMLDRKLHLVLEAPHPSPLSAHRGFFGCKHFSQANAWLKRTGQEPIDWGLPE